MSNIRDFNQRNPFWDFMSSLESMGSGPNHPFANAYNPATRDSRGPPPEYGAPPPADGSAPPADMDDPPEHSPEDFPFGGPRGGPHRHGGPHHHGGPHGGSHGHGRGGWGGRGAWGGRRGGGRCGGRERGFGGFPMGGNFDMSKLGEFIAQFVPEEVMAGAARDFGTKDTSNTGNSKDFTPPADIFDTEEAYVVHISLPGAKKEDVGVNWDADKSELNVAGVVYRPGDEAFLKTLALDERKVGVFDRKVVFGTKEKPANVDADAISAKMEDGVLIVTVPKVESFVEVKKVDIE